MRTTAHTSTAFPCVGCSTTRLPANPFRNASALITIRCSDSTGGLPTYACSRSGEVKTVPYAPISHPFVERLIGTIRREYLDRTFLWIARSSGTRLISRGSWTSSGVITTPAFIARLTASRQRNAPVHHPLPRRRSINTPGGGTAEVYFRHRLRLDYEFATHRRSRPDGIIADYKSLRHL